MERDEPSTFLVEVAEASKRDCELRGAVQLSRFVLGDFPRSTLLESIDSSIVSRSPPPALSAADRCGRFLLSDVRRIRDASVQR